VGWISRPFALTVQELDDLFNEGRISIDMTCRVLRGLVGGQPATEEEVEAYIKFHLKIDPLSDADEFQKTKKRIMTEELNQTIVPDGAEVINEKVYSINAVRKSALGVWLGNWMMQACIKQTASRLGLLIHKSQGGGKLGPKGDLAEMGRVEAIGISLVDPARPWEVHFRDPSSKGPATTHYETLRGSVDTAKGKMSIMYQAEVVDEGSLFSLRFSWPAGRLTAQDMCRIAANTRNVGLGSARSLGWGRFQILDLKGEDVKFEKEGGPEEPIKQTKETKKGKGKAEAAA
jgi:hypothetical protein